MADVETAVRRKRTKLTDPHLANIEWALQELLFLTERQPRRPMPHPPPERLRLMNLTEFLQDRTTKGEEIVKSPIAFAARYAIKDVGRHLHAHLMKLGLSRSDALDEMVRIAEGVAGRSRRRYGTRINILDKWWDGVGAGDGDAGWTS